MQFGPVKHYKDHKLLKQIGMRIKELRKQKKMTQLELSYQADCELQQIKRMEGGKHNSTISSISKVIQALDSTIQEFFNFD